MNPARESDWSRAVSCAKCCAEILAGDGRYNEPDGRSYHPLCYDALQPAPMSAMLTRVLEAEARKLTEIVDALVATRDDLNALERNALEPSPSRS